MTKMQSPPAPQSTRVAKYSLVFIFFAASGYYGTNHVLRGDVDVSLHHGVDARKFQTKPPSSVEDVISPSITEPIMLSDPSSYFVFLQKFPLEGTFKMIFHTEVIVCPRDAFEGDHSFLKTLDDLAATLTPPDTTTPTKVTATATATSEPTIPTKLRANDNSNVAHYATIQKSQWITQNQTSCTQLGYGGAACSDTCCSVPHVNGQNVGYPLNSKKAVISNAMGDYKELYLYGVSDVSKGGLSGEEAYRAVCRVTDPSSSNVFVGGDNNILPDELFMSSQDDSLPKCVSNWAGTDYNPLTNNCNTFTSTVLKCVFGLSDDKPNLGVSDMVKVQCPVEEKSNRCLVPGRTELALKRETVAQK